ncbi:type II toxin-antitoxin system Phd/YefM family antitoxin [Aerosakkonemataceae cyanobacterium BLCC-F154]|uniref:Antitoxin n=1 Tax=Floridaenema fluviatile BLCC-F154 TaxID=3153640 RepID=A0ABV4YIB2_9CYAN
MLSYKITSASDAKNDFLNLLDQVVENRQVYIINRREGENVALIAESDLLSLVETVYLLRSPANARRLMDAIEESKTGKIEPQTIAELQQELGIDKEEKKRKPIPMKLSQL